MKLSLYNILRHFEPDVMGTDGVAQFRRRGIGKYSPLCFSFSHGKTVLYFAEANAAVNVGTYNVELEEFYPFSPATINDEIYIPSTYIDLMLSLGNTDED